MVEGRIKVGILFSYSENWIGGSYYFLNLISSFLQLEDNDRPHVIIYADSEASLDKAKQTGYPYLSYLNSKFTYNLFERTINKVGRFIFKRNLFFKGYSSTELPILFGYYEQVLLHKCSRKIYWIPDLQDKHYPEYLGLQVAQGRALLHKKLGYSDSEIVFSSKDAEADFKRFYPGVISRNYVVPFAVSLPNISGISSHEVAGKYNINKPYFFSPNQFWSHKNHLTVIKAVEQLKKDGIETTVFFTGNENTGGGKYAGELKEYVYVNELTNNCFATSLITGVSIQKPQSFCLRKL